MIVCTSAAGTPPDPPPDPQSGAAPCGRPVLREVVDAEGGGDEVEGPLRETSAEAAGRGGEAVAAARRDPRAERQPEDDEEPRAGRLGRRVPPPLGVVRPGEGGVLQRASGQHVRLAVSRGARLCAQSLSHGLALGTHTQGANSVGAPEVRRGDARPAHGQTGS